jgi:hypothetical protein
MMLMIVMMMIMMITINHDDEDVHDGDFVDDHNDIHMFIYFFVF